MNSRTTLQPVPVLDRTRNVDMFAHRLIGETVPTVSGKTFRCDRIAPGATPGRVVAFDDRRNKVMKLRSSDDSEEVDRHARLTDKLRPGAAIDFPKRPVVLPGSPVSLDGLIMDGSPDFRDSDVISNISLEFVTREYVENIVNAYREFLAWLISEKHLFPSYGYYAPVADVCDPEGADSPAFSEFLRFFRNLIFDPAAKKVSVVSVGGLAEIPSSAVEASMLKVPDMASDLRSYLFCKRRAAGETLELDYEPWGGGVNLPEGHAAEPWGHGAESWMPRGNGAESWMPRGNGAESWMPRGNGAESWGHGAASPVARPGNLMSAPGNQAALLGYGSNF